MQYQPLVTIITPTYNRPSYMFRCMDFVKYQTYPNFEHLIDDSDRTIGEKLNRMCAKAYGSIIIRFDDDDLYASDWVERQVQSLLTTGADIVGLSNAYFYELHQRQMYELRQKPKCQLYLCGATLAFHKRVWERKPFKHISRGEDTDFISNNGKMACSGYTEGFTAIVHGSNTECHKALPLLHKSSAMPALLRKWYQ